MYSIYYIILCYERKKKGGVNKMRERKCGCRPCTESSASYSKSERDKFGGENRMQEKKFDDKEMICVNVDKVYDWIVKENTFDIFPTSPITFPGLPAGTSLVGATVTCSVVPAATNPVEILNRVDRQFCIDGKNVCLQQLNIRKNFEVTLVVTLANGTVLTSAAPAINPNLAFSRCEQVTLCPSEGTSIEVTFTDLDCFVCSPGVITIPTGTPAPPAGAINIAGLTLSIATCQSIQSTFPVTVELFADFCEPREDLPIACPTPSRPRQCPVVFPDDSHHHHGCGCRSSLANGDNC